MGTTSSKSAGTATAQSDETAGLSFQRRDILYQRKLLDEFEQNRKDDGYSQAAIEKERQRLDFLENCEDIRDLLDSSFVKFQENLRAMKTASDALNAIDNLPGEVKAFCRRFDNAFKDGCDTETAMDASRIQANVFLNKNFEFQMKANKLSVTDLEDKSKELISELKMLDDLNKFLLIYSSKMEEKVSGLKFDTLKSSLEKLREQLKSEKWKLIGIGIGASILAISGIGIFVEVGVGLWKLTQNPVAVPAKKIGSAFLSFAKPKISEYISEVSRNRDELKSIEQCLEVLKNLKPFELNTDQLKMAVQSTLSEAQKIREQTDCRLKEAERTIKSEQKVTELEQLLRETRLKEAERTIKSEQKVTELEQLLRQKVQEIETLKRAQTESPNPVNPV